MACDISSKPRACKAPKPFEGAELPSSKKSTAKDALTKSKSTRALAKIAPKRCVTIKKTVQVTVKAKKKQTEGNYFPQIRSSNPLDVIESGSEAAESEDFDSSSDDDHELPPAPLALASTEIKVSFNRKSIECLNRSNFDYNESYEDFMRNLDIILAAKVKQSLKVIENSAKVIRWKWYSIAKSLAKSQPLFNALETEAHYQQMQSDIRDTAYKNPVLRNMVMRLNIDIITQLDDGNMRTSTNDSLQVPTASRRVTSLILIAVVNKRP